MCPPTKLAVAVWLAAVCCLAAGSEQRGSGYQLEDLGLGEALPPDPAYLLPRLAQKFSALQQGERWQHVLDPKVYLLTETADQDMTGGMAPARRLKRTNGPSLSIVNPLDVLRQRLLLEIARRRMRQSEDQVIANREWLKTIGKRSIDQ